MRKPWKGSEFKGEMAAGDELHDLADDAVCADRGLGSAYDRGFVAVQLLGLGGCL